MNHPALLATLLAIATVFIALKLGPWLSRQ